MNQASDPDYFSTLTVSKKRATTDSRAADFSRRLSSLFAGIVGLTSLMLVVRFVILKHPPLRSLFPLACYQDLFFCALLAWLIYGLLRLPLGDRAQKLVCASGWSVLVLLAGYTALSAIVYTVIHAPITYPLLVSSDSLRGARASVSASLTSFQAKIVAESFLIFFGVSLGLRYLAAAWLQKVIGIFYKPAVSISLIVYVVIAHLWIQKHVRYLAAIQNPELALASSAYRPTHVLVTDPIPRKYLAEFARAQVDPPRAISWRNPITGIHASSQPYNVLLVIMESVGVRRLQLYGAPYSDTPEMLRLAQHALVFDRIYVSQAYTSAAMAALFCSLYPQFEWKPVTRSEPNITVPGIAALLAAHGYATAFIHSGTLTFDREGQFLADHGFQTVLADADDATAPADYELLSRATSWLKSNKAKPFFLALWTQDTHHPYFASTAYDYRVSNPNLNRYLNAIHSTDNLISQLTQRLDALGIADNTLVVITGDHGEAFGEHGQTAHNWTVYDEEMRIPLLIENPKLIPYARHIGLLGQQIDIAPTILSMLGYPEPSLWEGSDLFGSRHRKRAFLFSRYGDYTFGLVDGRFKYIYDLDRRRTEFYDLVRDPAEVNDLSSESQLAPTLKDDHLRVEAWIDYQQSYLKRLKPGCTDGPTPANQAACSSLRTAAK